MKGNYAQIPNDQNPCPYVQNATCIENIVSHGPEDAYYEHGNNDDAMKKNRTDDEMYNDGAKRVSNPKMSCCKNGIRGEIKMMNQR